MFDISDERFFYFMLVTIKGGNNLQINFLTPLWDGAQWATWAEKLDCDFVLIWFSMHIKKSSYH